MNELDKLRGMLLDSGTEFLDQSSDLTVGYYTDPHSVTESMDGTLIVTGLTAEQVMLALGPMTCQADETDTWECVCDGIGHYGERVTVHVMECPECGRTYEHVNGDYEYCPHCGRRIVEVADG